MEARSCPYCGKRYPRAAQDPEKYVVVLLSMGTDRDAVIQALQKSEVVTSLYIRAALKQLPMRVSKPCTQALARGLMRAIRAAGGSAKVIPWSIYREGLRKPQVPQR